MYEYDLYKNHRTQVKGDPYRPLPSVMPVFLYFWGEEYVFEVIFRFYLHFQRYFAFWHGCFPIMNVMLHHVSPQNSHVCSFIWYVSIN